ncbi:hypothetical protein J1605_021944 [Eschrichtius robustus]|uniref:Coiled-coil SMC6 And NSE5 INteracting (CANIN) domain-containing protein n=1 Tax=Eschrichtius robustus TaxID=9764 RepID=A0AB34HDD6_ESCRO|nr:hypothetical protein J1605_021944 [Eschrichtius robustus]
MYYAGWSMFISLSLFALSSLLIFYHLSTLADDVSSYRLYCVCADFKYINGNNNKKCSETQMTLGVKESEDSSCKPIFSSLPETNILNVVKFLGLCTSIHPEGYQDCEIMLLILMLFKMSLEKQLKQIPLVDFQSLLINLMKNIRDWNTKVPELCLAINELSSHPHNLLWLVQLVPNWTSRGRQLRQCLSLVIISKLLDEKHEDIPNANNLQISVLHRYLVQMKPSDLLKKMVLKKRAEQPNGTIDDSLHLELEKQAYYLTYILLHLVGEVSCSHSFSSGQRKHFVHLCGALEKHVKCDIREDARLFYRTKVKDLVARIHGKWQEIIQNCRPTQAPAPPTPGSASTPPLLRPRPLPPAAGAVVLWCCGAAEPRTAVSMAGDLSAKKTDLREPGLALLSGQGDPISDLQPLCDPNNSLSPWRLYLMPTGSV